MARLFAITLFVSAFLLFWVQPLVAKLLLPLLGGSPTVWNVAMCFFQAALLAGYAWAHWLSNRTSPKTQLWVHAGTLAAAALLLPFAISPDATQSLATGTDPFLWLLKQLALICGVPFFLLSANSPLLQRWFAGTGHPRAHDPYFLFAASNAGSFLALIAFPLALEPAFTLQGQSGMWTAGYLALAALAAMAGVMSLRGHSRNSPATPTATNTRPETTSEAITTGRRLKWIALAFVPSSLMLGVTQFLTTDVAAVPLLWVLPLGLYLLTFVIAFGPRTMPGQTWLRRLLPILVIAVMFTIISSLNDPIWMLFPLHLMLLTVCGLVCHGRLAADRPPAGSLTEFYFYLSLGGVLGGVFNGLLAPMLFDRVAEYPLLLATMALLAENRIPPAESRIAGKLRWTVAVGVGLLTATLMTAVVPLAAERVQLANLIAFGLPCVVVFFLVDHPWRFAVALLSLLVAGWTGPEFRGQTLVRERNFFGVSRVELDASGQFHQLYHGSTIHGRQFVNPKHQHMPLSYYHNTGPLRQIMGAFEGRETSRNVAVIGLGAGAMAAYAKPGQEWTFYEIDPVVIRMAQDTNHFTYLAQCNADKVRIVQGDARLRLAEAPDASYGLIVLDAFSSDSVPVHLLTREAMQLYLAKLAPDGVIGFHVSNRNLDVKAVVRTLAGDAGLFCIERDEEALGSVEVRYGKDPAQWSMAAREPKGLEELVRPEFWDKQPPVPGLVWTDDHSSIWRVIKR